MLRAFRLNCKTIFGRVIWSTFAVCISIFTLAFLYVFIIRVILKAEEPENRQWLSNDIYVYNDYDDTPQYIRNNKTGKIIVKEPVCIQVSRHGDEMVMFSEYGKYGYLNRKTGDLLLKPQYDKAWMFSEGYAAVCMEDSLFFIDKTGKEYYKELGLCRQGDFYYPNYEFHQGLCVVSNRKGKWGILKSDGTWALPIQYDEIEHNDRMGLWLVSKNDYRALLNENMKEVFGGEFLFLNAKDAEHIYVMPKDSCVQQRYNLKGELLDACIISSTRQLTYTVDRREIVKTDSGSFESVVREDVATCLSYCVCEGQYGLMSKSGEMITQAVYCDISAIGPDLYLCQYDDSHSVIVNSRGEKMNN